MTGPSLVSRMVRLGCQRGQGWSLVCDECWAESVLGEVQRRLIEPQREVSANS
jgi:hypothetical protein